MLIELARVTNLKPRIEAKSNTPEENYQVSKPELDSKVLVDLSTEQQLRLQNSSTNTNYLERLNLNETHLYQEPNTPEESYQVSKPELDFKVLVEPYTEQQLGHQSTSTNTFRRVLVNFTDLTPSYFCCVRFQLNKHKDLRDPPRVQN